MRRACCEDHEYPEVVLALIPVMKKETAETYLGMKVNGTLVMVPAYNDSSGRPDLRHGRSYLRRALLTIEMESLDMTTAGDTHLGQTHERHGLVCMEYQLLRESSCGM